MAAPATTADKDAEELFRDALADFQSSLTDRQREAFLTASLNQVKCQIHTMQNEQERSRNLLNFSRAGAFLTGFAQFEEVCKAVNVGVEHLSGSIWGPTTYVLQMAKEDQSVLDAILETYQKLGKRLPLLGPHKNLLKEKPDMKSCLASMYGDLLRFHRRILDLFKERNWKKTFHANWRDYSSELETLLEAFDSLGTLLSKLVSSHQHQVSQNTTQRMNDHFARYNHDRHDILRHAQQYDGDRDSLLQGAQASQDSSQRLDDIARRQEEQIDALSQHIRQYQENSAALLAAAEEQAAKRRYDQFVAVRTWIAAKNQTEYQEKFQGISKEFPGTGQWILDDDKMWNWINAETPTQSMLWMNGKPGAGKTILASLLIDHCSRIEDNVSDAKTKTSYFYCREDDPTQNTCLAICKGILHQLVDHWRDLLPSCVEKQERGAERLAELNTTKSLIDLFCDVNMNQFIIIDGLDECEPPERKALVQFLSAIVDRCDGYKPGKLRVLLVSRDLADIRRSMQSAGIFDLDDGSTQGDIKLFVNKQIGALKEKFRLNVDDAARVERLTCSRSDGMFLFVTLVIDNLMKQPNVGRLLSELRESTFPRNLEQAYNKIIERLHRDLGEHQWHEARKIFGWLACAKRPLKWHELQAALSIKEDCNGHGAIDFYHQRLSDDIRDICGSLIQVMPESGIEFIHSTARGFIIKNQNLDERAIECDLAILCLNYLSLDWFRKDLDQRDRARVAERGYYVFQDYAVSKWKHHLESMISKAAPLLDDSEKGRAYRNRLSNTLRRFYSVYSVGLSADPESNNRQHNGLQDTEQPQIDDAAPAVFCEAFKQEYFYQDLLRIWTHVYKHQNTSDFKTRNKVSIKELGEALVKIRTTLESLDPPSDAVAELYGSNLFKCTRVTCDYFYEGFPNKQAQHNHNNRHDRPFHCPVRGCALVPFGFSSNKDREKHVRQYHPEESDSPAPFAQLTRKVVDETRHQCHICRKNFTRGANLRAHRDSHFGVRSFACSVCGKAFTRANDRRRHERTVHTRRVRPQP